MVRFVLGGVLLYFVVEISGFFLELFAALNKVLEVILVYFRVKVFLTAAKIKSV